MSRLQSAKTQRSTIEGLLDGSVDVVIGTHRILSKDVKFKNLGLVIVDEEQRFGRCGRRKSSSSSSGWSTC